MTKYLNDQAMEAIVGGGNFDITVFHTGTIVPLPAAAANQITGYNTADNIDPYGKSGGRLTAGDGLAVPGISQIVV